MNFTGIPKWLFSLAAMAAVFVLFYALIYPKEEVCAGSLGCIGTHNRKAEEATAEVVRLTAEVVQLKAVIEDLTRLGSAVRTHMIRFVITS